MKQQTDLLDPLRAARSQLAARFSGGEQQQRTLIETVSKNVIVDRLVSPKSMKFVVVDDDDLRSPIVMLEYKRAIVDGKDSIDGVLLHRHAFGQLCAKVQLPMPYVGRLEEGNSKTDDWKLQLLVHSLNQLFHKTPWKEGRHGSTLFLHRIVGGQLRGFLTRKYNRHLASAPLLRTFVQSAAALGAKPVEATSSDVRVALKCVLPEVYEVCPGEYIALGVEFSNSDFGAGRQVVAQTVWRVGTGTSFVLDEKIGRVHLGSVIQESDIEMSDETARKELEALQSAVNDAVVELLSQKTAERIVEAMRVAKEAKIPWQKLKVQLAGVLNKSDVDWMQQVLQTGEGIIDLPPVSFDPDGARVPNAYWAAAALGSVALRAEDPDRKLALQREAGKLLEVALPGA